MNNCICVICKESFPAKRSDAKYCSDDCKAAGRRANYCKDIEHSREIGRKNASAFVERNRDEVNRKKRERRIHTMYEKTCIYCGETFAAKRRDQISCGKRDKLHRPNEKSKMVELTCEYCGKTFTTQKQHYEQYVLARGKKMGCCQHHTHILNGKVVVLTCGECGKTFERAKSTCEQDNPEGGYVFCSTECWKKNLDYRPRGENHSRYIDGKSSGYRGKGWGRIRRRIRERDNHTCYLCGKTREDIGKELDVHHSLRFEDFEDENDANRGVNLISLCPSCHHSEEVNPTISRIVTLIRERKELRAA